MMRTVRIVFGCLATLAWPGLSFADAYSDGVQNYLSGRPDLILCVTYSLTPTDSLRAELVRRKLLSAVDWKTLDTKSSSVGMSECGLLANEGVPFMISGDERQISGTLGGVPDGKSYDVVYGLKRLNDGVYALIKNGIVTDLIFSVE
jgi:hypothetical protein